MQNILVTSISNKIPLLEVLNESKNLFDSRINIYGGDINENVLGIFFVDFFWKMPKLENLIFEDLIKYCKTHKIKYIIPTRDEDVVFFSSLREKLEEIGIYVFSSNINGVKLCFDKYEFVKNNGLDFNIKTSLDIDELNGVEKFVIKERFGSGSKSIGIDLSENDARKFSKNLEDPIFQEYINGDEYSIDAYVNKENRCIGIITRRREVVRDGEAVITSTVTDKNIEDKIKYFLELNKIQGHSITQVIKQNDEYFLVECNTRFGGASTLSYKMGLKSFYWFFCEVNNQEFTFEKSSKNFRQVRVPKDIYFEC